MKKLYSLITLMLISAASFSATFYVYTAQKSGSWNDMSVWAIAVRTDGVAKTKVAIPSPYIVNVDNAVNSFGLGDVEIYITGTLSILPSTTINLSSISSITLLNAGKIVGTSANQTIIIGTTTKYNGSLDGTKSGPSYSNATTGSAPKGFAFNATLPVKLTSFTAATLNGRVQLNWATASESRNAYFQVERSFDGVQWSAIAKVKGTGTTSTASSYQFADANAGLKTVYYRLKQVDIDEKFEYSVVKTVKGVAEATVRIFGSNKNVNVEVGADAKTLINVVVLDLNGNVIKRQQFNSGTRMTMNIPAANGEVVLVNVSDSRALNQTAKLFL